MVDPTNQPTKMQNDAARNKLIERLREAREKLAIAKDYANSVLAAYKNKVIQYNALKSLYEMGEVERKAFSDAAQEEDSSDDEVPESTRLLAIELAERLKRRAARRNQDHDEEPRKKAKTSSAVKKERNSRDQ